MFQEPHSTRDNLYLSVQALSYTSGAGRRVSGREDGRGPGGEVGHECVCRHLIGLVLVGETMEPAGVPYVSPWSDAVCFFFFFVHLSPSQKKKKDTVGEAHLRLRTCLFFHFSFLS